MEEITEDCLIVTIDFPKKGYKERPFLMVGRKTKDSMKILNVLSDDDAIDTYKKLVGTEGDNYVR